MRRIALPLLVALLAPAALAAPPTFEPQTDLPGFDYRNFDLPRPRPRLCQEACAGDAQCHAWTFVQTGILGPLASCWLKTGTAEKRTNACCISGEK
jgi:PAN domain